jgi:putative hydrolase of the HAD superfamily
VIRRLGLDKLVDGVRTSDAYRCPKTCPEYFQDADLMVGDNPVFDVYFPKRFGLLAIFYGDWEREAAEHARRLAISIDAVRPDGVVKNLKELPDAVRRVLALR